MILNIVGYNCLEAFSLTRVMNFFPAYFGHVRPHNFLPAFSGLVRMHKLLLTLSDCTHSCLESELIQID
jgi:hypothetical protein